MKLALGISALFIGSLLVISGVTKKALPLLLIGYWSTPSGPSGPVGTQPGGKTTTGPRHPGNASSGGVHAQANQPVSSFI